MIPDYRSITQETVKRSVTYVMVKRKNSFFIMKIASKLLRWYQTYGRDLPWRHTRNPYHILVSEMMLQQTQVDRVKLFYNRWITQFPNWKRLAQASTEEIIHTCAGL